MIKKYFMIITIFCMVMLISIPMVQAATIEPNTYEREMAIACALSYMPLTENKTIGLQLKLGPLKDFINNINAIINVHDFASIEELDDWIVADFHNKEITEKSLAAFVLQKDNDLMIIFRGTDLEGFGDFLYGVKNYHGQEEYANKYVLEIMDRYSKKEGKFNIYVAGHSLGGYLAQTSGATIQQNIDKYNNLSLKKIVTFNGIGINFFTYYGDKYNYGNQNKTIETLKELGNQGKLIEYFTYGDLVSALGVHYGEMRMLLPSIDSVEYHRTNYKLLGNINQKLNFSNTLYKLTQKDRFNAFKTDVHNAKELYKTSSLVAFLNLTHESDVFTSIENEKSLNKPSIKTVESTTGVLSEYLKQNKNTFETKKSITIRAITSSASVKKYVWEVSTNNKKWKEVKVSTLNINDPKYNKNDNVTNTYQININDFKEGETKYFRITAYYDDNYVSSKYNFNEDKGLLGEYEYVVDNEKSKNEKAEKVQKIIKVKRPEEPKTVKNIKNALKNIFNIKR